MRAYARGEKISPRPLNNEPGAHAWYCRGCEEWHHPRFMRHFRNGVQYCDSKAYEYDVLEHRLNELSKELPE